MLNQIFGLLKPLVGIIIDEVIKQANTPTPSQQPSKDAHGFNPPESARTFVVPEKPPSSEPPEFAVVSEAEKALVTMLSIKNRSLARYMSSRGKEWAAISPEDRQQQRKAAFEKGFVGDPLAIALDLYQRIPARRSLPSAGSMFTIMGLTFDDVLREAWRRSIEAHNQELRFTDDQMKQALGTMIELIRSGLADPMHIYDYHYAHIVRAAAADNWPKWRGPLISVFSMCIKDETFRHSRIVALIGTLVESTPLTRSEIPELQTVDAASRKLDTIRARIVKELGEPVGAAFICALEQQHYVDPKNISEFEKVRALSPTERGASFAKLLDILTAPQAYGLTRWGQLRKANNAYQFGISYQEMPQELGLFLLQFTKQKIEIPQSDKTIAQFCGLLPQLWHHRDRKVLKIVLETMKSNPNGATVARMREFVNARSDVHPFHDYRIEIEDTLRALTSGDACTATTDLGDMPPLLPPIEDLDSYNYMLDIPRHFDNVWDVRLYDSTHRALLHRLTSLKHAITAHHDGGADVTSDAIAKVARTHGFAVSPYQGSGLFISVAASAAARGAEINNRIEAFTPFVTQFPVQARKLTRLVEEIASKSAPTRKWMKEGDEALRDVPADVHLAMLESLVENPVFCELDVSGDASLRTLIYLSSKLDPAMIGPYLVKLAIQKCYVKASKDEETTGIRFEKAGNACVWALSEMPNGAGIPYLARIQRRVRYPKIKSLIDRRLDEAAKSSGLSRGEMDEVTVPTHGLDLSGSLSRTIGNGQTTIYADDKGIGVRWTTSSGQDLKSPSTAMSADTETLKSIRALVKEIKADLLVQVDRLQHIFLEKRQWPADIWHQRYCDHPLVGTLARRLIWWVESKDGTLVSAMPSPDGKQMVSVTGEAVEVASDAVIRLWHPIDAQVGDIEAWRDRLDQSQLSQPFSQAWREVYILTDAERTTNTYSNRWAAHILRQHQTMELARANRWKVTHRVGFDTSNDKPWCLTIGAYGLVADYWVSGCGGEHGEYSPGGAFTYISTDRLQFLKSAAKIEGAGPNQKRGDIVPLAEIPLIVFSEVMRQGDLFTSVASIGNDPTWLDDGADAQHPNNWRYQANQYWHNVNIGELEASAKRRHAILKRTIPRLKLAEKLSLDDRYLNVTGSRGNYRIHLGGGGAFRGERHLCIVPKGDPSTGKVWLPFEGDRTLSIILSKAMLLAEDHKITDPVILAQL